MRIDSPAMPPGAPYDSFVLPYRIRVDNFTNNDNNVPLLHLLTHTHSDHITGLAAQSFGYKVVCSQDAKEMLLRHETYGERELHQLEMRTEPTRTFSHLKVDPVCFPDGTTYSVGSRDLLEVLPLHVPTFYELTDSESVTITAFDANHCPGAVMYLIEGDKGAILHTGDFRAEPWFLESLIRNPFLQPYLAPRDGASGKAQGFSRILDTIYLDTANVLSTISVPSKECATSGLIKLMKLFPESCYFFINSWTWGYEDILKAVSREFASPIHVDRYKHSVYRHTSDPFLRRIITHDPSSTRFHACERFHRCEHVAVNDLVTQSSQFKYNAVGHTGKRVVYVNPVNMGAQSWELYLKHTKATLENGVEINLLLVPLSRHSPLPELREFVSLFKPRRIVPNTLDPRLHGIDWVAINRMFADCLHPSELIEAPVALDVGDLISRMGLEKDEDVALANLVGNGAANLAAHWAENGSFQRKIEVLKLYLDLGGKELVDRIFGVSSSAPRKRSDDDSASAGELQVRHDKGQVKGKQRAMHADSEDENDNGWGSEDDARGRTAHLLFSHLAGIEGMKEHEWWAENPHEPEQPPDDIGSNQWMAKPTGRRAEGSGPSTGAIKDKTSNLLVSVTSPVRPLRPCLSRPLSPHCNPSPIAGTKPEGESPKSDSDPSFQCPPNPLAAPLGSPFQLMIPAPKKRQTGNEWEKGMLELPSPSFPLRKVRKKNKKHGFPSSEPSPPLFMEPVIEPTKHTRKPSSKLPDTLPALPMFKAGVVHEPVASSSEARSPICSPPLVEVDMNNEQNMGKTWGSVGADIAYQKQILLAPWDENREARASPPQRPYRSSQQSKRNEPVVLSPCVKATPQARPYLRHLLQSQGKLERSLLSTRDRGPRIDLRLISSAKKRDSKRKAEAQDEQAQPREEGVDAKRLRIAESLARACPDLVVPTFAKKRVQLLARIRQMDPIVLGKGVRDGVPADSIVKCRVEASRPHRPRERLESHRTASLSSFKTVDDDDGGMDWNRSRVLAEALKKDVRDGKRPVLPMLLCTDSQNLEQS